MSLRRILAGTGADIAGTGTGIPGVGVPWKNVGPSGKPMLETGPLVMRPLLPRLRGMMTEKLPIEEPAYHARFGAGEMFQVARKNPVNPWGKPQLEIGEYQVESKPTLRFRSLLASRNPAAGVEVPWKVEDKWGKPSLETDYQVERKPRFEDLEGLASKPLETQLAGNPMPIRAGRTRRAIRDRTRILSRVEKLRSSPRVETWKLQQFELEKFTKDQTFYVDHSLYPFMSCRDCVWFLPAETQPDNKPRCTVVGEAGGSGIINPEGTSTGFNASPRRLKLIERLYGRGEGKTGALPQVIRSRLMPIGKALLYPNLPTELQQVPPLTATGMLVSPGSNWMINSPVTFTASVTGGLVPYHMTWDFGDGTAAADMGSQTHIYTNPGAYTILATITDSLGSSVEETATIVVGTPTPAQQGLAPGPTAPAPGPMAPPMFPTFGGLISQIRTGQGPLAALRSRLRGPG